MGPNNPEIIILILYFKSIKEIKYEVFVLNKIYVYKGRRVAKSKFFSIDIPTHAPTHEKKKSTVC